MRKSIISLAIILYVTAIYGQSNDHQYIWAPSGLNLRVAPSIDSDVVDKLPFGDSLIVIAKTDIAYTTMGIKHADTSRYYYSRYERIAPYILYGNWIKVLSSKGKTGFIISQYVIPLSTAYNPFMPETEFKSDTLIINKSEWPGRYVKNSYPLNIYTLDYLNEKSYFETFYFPNMTIQQVFVMFSSTENELPYQVRKNWKEALHFDDNEMCFVSIQQKSKHVELIWACSC